MIQTLHNPLTLTDKNVPGNRNLIFMTGQLGPKSHYSRTLLTHTSWWMAQAYELSEPDVMCYEGPLGILA